jgi:translocation and assembly module TamA
VRSSLCLLSLLLGLTACASWRDGKADRDKPPPTHYTLDVTAPEELRALLRQHLDLAHMQHARDEDGWLDADLDRLMAAAPAQVRALLETEGYFTPEVQVARSPDADGPPRVEVRVTPGPRTTVDDWQLVVAGALTLPLAVANCVRPSPRGSQAPAPQGATGGNASSRVRSLASGSLIAAPTLICGLE